MAKLSSTILMLFLALIIAGCGTPAAISTSTSRDIDSVALKVEIMAEVRKLLTLHGISVASVEKTREQLKSEIKDDVLKQLQMIAPDSEVVKAAIQVPKVEPAIAATGIAEGQILRNGQGLPDCHVKLVRLVESQTLAGLLKVSKEGVEFETVTDKDGRYHFEAIPVGSYKLKWQLPDDTGWIRRLRDKPDVNVEAGTTKVLKAIETRRGLTPH